jgi:hypothetical protein
VTTARAQLDAGMSPDRMEASAERVLGDRPGNPTATSGAFCRGYDEVAGACAPEARELEAGG